MNAAIMLIIGIILSAGIGVIFSLGFLVSYTRYEQQLIDLAPNIIIKIVSEKMLGRIRETAASKDTEIDSVLQEILSTPPKYTYKSNYEQFLSNFDKYKRFAINFPTDRHEQFMNHNEIAGRGGGG